jgi:DNA topoisomerase IB
VAHALREVSDYLYLGHTPAVCHRSYIDSRVIDHLQPGETISNVISRLGADAEAGELASIGAAERAVLCVLTTA